MKKRKLLITIIGILIIVGGETITIQGLTFNI